MNSNLKYFGKKISYNQIRYISAFEIRKHFIDYFIDKKHIFVKSSPVKPFNDHSLEFVNAGMNQFKNVFLGLTLPPGSAVTNSQKCIRIGGKHNDLDIVGYDSYHHTFFEMLGNWSFGDYFKEDACRLAWNLITSSPYSLPKNQLYVTYFGGDETLSLSPDLETKEIWKKIGVSDERILPFGIKDNFWEMGITGPCGPCTEIHYDHLGSKPRINCVNKDFENLTELWNLVFIQYKRNEDGSLTNLKQSYVDTGMGLERLVAILQKKSSNYDTDLFTPLFQFISKYSKTKPYNGKYGQEDVQNLDTNYRILADHARMITSSLADSMFPDQSHGLRRVIRKSFDISENFCPGKGHNLLTDLTKVVGDTLGQVYPEMVKNNQQAKYIIQNEYELYKQVHSVVQKDWERLLNKNPLLMKLSDVQSVGLVDALNELHKKLKKGDLLEPSLALILYDRYGINPQLIEEIAQIEDYKFDPVRLNNDIIELKKINKSSLHSSNSLNISKNIMKIITNYKPTDETERYSVMDKKYNLKPLKAQILAVFNNSELINYIEPDQRIGILLDKTNFWTHSKGESDTGIIKLKQGEINIDNVVRIGNYIIHYGTSKSKLTIDSSALLHIDYENRINLMRNVTASHLLTNAIKNKFVPNLQLFINTKNNFMVKYSIYGPNISEGECILFEHIVNIDIKNQIDINVSHVLSKDLLNSSETNIPHIINTENEHFPVVHISGQDNKEISYGPNVLNSKDILEFCFTNVDVNRKKQEVIFKCLTGPNVDRAYKNTEELLNNFYSLNEESETELINEELSKAKILAQKNLIPISLRIELNHLVSKFSSILKQRILNEQIKDIKDLVLKSTQNKTSIVHYVGEDSDLKKLTRLSLDLPIMLFSYNKGCLSARCCCPKSCNIGADEWMNNIAERLNSVSVALKGHDIKEVSSLKPVKMSKEQVDKIMDELKNLALSFINNHGNEAVKNENR